MISAINSYGQNKVKVQKQNFGQVPPEVIENAPNAYLFLIKVQGNHKLFEKGDRAILDQRIQEAKAKKQFGAALRLGQLKDYVNKNNLG